MTVTGPEGGSVVGVTVGATDGVGGTAVEEDSGEEMHAKQRMVLHRICDQCIHTQPLTKRKDTSIQWTTRLIGQ